MNRIQRLSWWVLLLLKFGRGYVVLFLLVLMLVEWIGGGGESGALVGVTHGFLGQFGNPTQLPDDLPIVARLLLSAWLLVGCGLMLRWLGHAIGLFALYRRNILFSGDNVRHFRGLGVIALVGTLLKPLCALTMNWWVLSGSETKLNVLEFIEVEHVMFSLVILLISWVMEEARKLREAEELVI